MKSSSWVVCRAFMGKMPAAKQEALLRYLPDEDRKNFEKLPISSSNPAAAFLPLNERLSQIHHTWLAPLFRNMPEREIRLFVSSLSEAQSEPLRKILRFTNGRLNLSHNGLFFLHTTLWEKLTSDAPDLLPLSLLPPSPVNALLDLKTVDLHALIDLLGLHDLAPELKQIIDTGRLKKIYAMLSENEQNYLRILMQSREPVTFTPMGVSSWQGDGAAFKAAIYQRGMNRLAKALFGQDPSFLWHLTHKMEFDKAMALQKMCSPMESLTAVKVLIAQVLELLSFMRKSHE